MPSKPHRQVWIRNVRVPINFQIGAERDSPLEMKNYRKGRLKRFFVPEKFSSCRDAQIAGKKDIEEGITEGGMKRQGTVLRLE